MTSFRHSEWNFFYSFSQTRSLALRALGFRSSSSSPETIGLRLMSLTLGLLPHTHTGSRGGQVQPLAASAIPFFMIRSSREWKVMTASRVLAVAQQYATRSKEVEQ